MLFTEAENLRKAILEAQTEREREGRGKVAINAIINAYS